MSFYAYIILCKNGRYYVCHAKDPNLRFVRHLSKDGARFTKQNRPVRILWTQEFSTEIEAAKREKQIKGWGRKKKENLIKGIWK